MVWAPLAGGGILTGAKFATFTCWKRMRTICPVAESSKPHYIRALSHRCLRLATTSCLSECGTGPFHPLEVALDASRRAGECGKSQYRSAGGIPDRAMREFSYEPNRYQPNRRQCFCRYSHPLHTQPSPFAAKCRSDDVWALWRTQRM